MVRRGKKWCIMLWDQLVASLTAMNTAKIFELVTYFVLVPRRYSSYNLMEPENLFKYSLCRLTSTIGGRAPMHSQFPELSVASFPHQVLETRNSNNSREANNRPSFVPHPHTWTWPLQLNFKFLCIHLTARASTLLCTLLNGNPTKGTK